MPAVTLNRHVIEEEHKHHPTTGELSRLLIQMGYAGKVLSREIGRAALVGKLGLIGEKNATGDAQKKLDVYANDTVVEAFAETGMVAAIVSEEEEKLRVMSSGAQAKYLLCMDPLDGSSNTDINGSIGTIFGIYRRKPELVGKDVNTQELLLQGSQQVAAGYVMYSTSTVMVYTTGHGVYGFTLDRELGEFLLSHDNIRCPAKGHYYSANLGHFYQWSQGLQDYVDFLEESDKASGRPYSLRYTGALVADVHRSLVEGGLYFYPPDAGHPDGKLRLMYECAPLGFIVEQAGGRASSGTKRILDIQAESIHQRSPLAIGSAEEIALYERYVSGKS